LSTLSGLVLALQQSIAALQTEIAALGARLGAVESTIPDDHLLALGTVPGASTPTGVVFDVVTGATRWSFGSASWQHVALAGTRMFAANSNTNVSIIDTKTGAQVGSVNTGNLTNGLTVNEAGSRVYAHNSAAAFAIDAATGVVLRSFYISGIIKVASTPTRLFVLAQQPSTGGTVVHEINPENGSYVRQWSTPAARNLAVSGDHVAMADAASTGKVFVLNMQNGAVATFTTNAVYDPQVYAGQVGGTFSVVGIGTGNVVSVVTLDAAATGWVSAAVFGGPITSSAVSVDRRYVFLATAQGTIVRVDMLERTMTTFATMSTQRLATSRTW
jgi:DNA-binding beta-propeller fold protein YncE